LKDILRLWWDALKRRFVLTRQEKRVVIFVLTALALGLLARHYREVHPLVSPAKIDKKSAPLQARNVSPAPLSSPKRQKRADVTR
jgi:hypothetical protein